MSRVPLAHSPAIAQSPVTPVPLAPGAPLVPKRVITVALAHIVMNTLTNVFPVLTTPSPLIEPLNALLALLALTPLKDQRTAHSVSQASSMVLKVIMNVWYVPLAPSPKHERLNALLVPLALTHPQAHRNVIIVLQVTT